jgi:hypothetical protein
MKGRGLLIGLLIVVIVLILFLAVAGSFGFSNFNFNYDLFSFVQGISNGVQGTSNEYSLEIDLNNEKELVIDTLNGFINLLSWDKNYIFMEVIQNFRGFSDKEVKELIEETRPVITKNDQTVEIITPKLPRIFLFRSYGVSLNLYVPSEMISRYDLRTSNGSFDVQNISGEIFMTTSNGRASLKNLSGDVKVNTSNGAIISENVNGNMDFSTSNGSFSGEYLNGNLKVVSSNGPLTLSNSEVQIYFKTSNGRININENILTGNNNYIGSSNGGIYINSDLENTGEMEVRTSNSEITMLIPENKSAEIEADTSNGKIILNNIEILAKEIGKTDLKGSVYGGGDLNIILKTSNSNIVIGKR